MEIDYKKMRTDFETFYEYYCKNIKLTRGKNAILPDREITWVFYSRGRLENNNKAYEQGVSDLLKYQAMERVERS